jgi:hypothetical protein
VFFGVQKTECFECGKSGHVARVCPNKYSKPRSSTGVCLLCGRLGHDASTCSGEYDPDDLKVCLFAAMFIFFCKFVQLLKLVSSRNLK